MSDLDSLRSFLVLHFARVSAKQLPQIQQAFGNLVDAGQASLRDWEATGLLTPKQKERLAADDLSQRVDEALTWSQGERQSILTLEDAAYPDRLRQISDAPILLYARGDVSGLKDPQLAVVGSRNASKQGKLTASDFAHYLAESGMTVTSGLASGIDKAAHEGALSAKTAQGSTIAVVATGLDRVYPAANRDLARQIAEQGVMVSEYALGTQPMAHFFPQRNRIISGLSLGVLVVEAALKSGSLITARTANEQGREVFAVPGSIHNPQAKGCHQLIKQGAKLVESGQDILEELKPILKQELSQSSEKSMPAESGGAVSRQIQRSSESKLLSLIGYEPIGLDELVVLSKKAVSELQSELVMLELEGKIEAMSAGRWRRIR